MQFCLSCDPKGNFCSLQFFFQWNYSQFLFYLVVVDITTTKPMHKSNCISSEIVTRTVAGSQWLISWQKCAYEFFAYSILEKTNFSHQHSIKSICMLWLEYSSSIFWNKKVHCAFCLVIFPKFLGSMSIMSWRSVAFVVIVESISWFGVDRHEMVPNGSSLQFDEKFPNRLLKVGEKGRRRAIVVFVVGELLELLPFFSWDQ